MYEERVDEPLRKVYVLFGGGRIRPVALLRGERRYRVTRLNASWVDRSLRPSRHGFSVTVDTGEIFQLLYTEGDPVWRLESVLME